MDVKGARTPTDFKKYGESTEVRCKLCGDKYPYAHMESHVIGVHGLDGPKEMYIDDQKKRRIDEDQEEEPPKKKKREVKFV